MDSRNPMGEAELQLFRDLVQIVGADFNKLASARGEEPVRMPDSEIPGAIKLASLTTLPIDKILEDPNFREGINHELKIRQEEWWPSAMKVFGFDGE